MVDTLQKMLSDGDATDAELSHWLDVPEAALAELGPERLSRSQRCKLRRAAFIIAAARTALGDRERAYRWLRRQNRALGGAVPVERISTQLGARTVRQLLGRIEYGGIS